ncbi:MAG: hypothetical protein HYU34_01485 [Candidatus Omnitrophica bacterium]|nr:hypothetical protein [Candidatus Omnitrophota bacterium]
MKIQSRVTALGLPDLLGKIIFGCPGGKHRRRKEKDLLGASIDTIFDSPLEGMPLFHAPNPFVD